MNQKSILFLIISSGFVALHPVKKNVDPKDVFILYDRYDSDDESNSKKKNSSLSRTRTRQPHGSQTTRETKGKEKVHSNYINRPDDSSSHTTSRKYKTGDSSSSTNDNTYNSDAASALATFAIISAASDSGGGFDSGGGCDFGGGCDSGGGGCDSGGF